MRRLTVVLEAVMTGVARLSALRILRDRTPGNAHGCRYQPNPFFLSDLCASASLRLNPVGLPLRLGASAVNLVAALPR
jgi:hypothetical protein